jgi:hypothetical protein
MSKIVLGFTQAVGEFVELALEVCGVDHGGVVVSLKNHYSEIAGP